MGETVRWPKLEAVCKIFEDLPTAVAWAENRIFLGAVHKWYHQISYEGVHEAMKNMTFFINLEIVFNF